MLSTTFTHMGISVPQHTLGGIRRYVEDRIPPGGFLTAVLCNDLTEAVGRADSENTYALPAIVAYIYNETPADCHGSREIVAKWLDHA